MTIKHHRVLIGIILAYFFIGLAYLWATPLFEASDELRHFGMVNYLRENRALPVQDPDNLDTPYHQEGSQPPLYYILAAVLVTPFNFDDFDTIFVENPHAKLGLPHVDDNKNMVLRDSHVPPLRGAALSAYLLRVIGLMLGAVTVTFVYLTARMVTQRDTVALVAAGITAFNPMFIFIMASVNNDTLVTALNSIAIFLIVWLLRDGFALRRSIALAFIIMLATLTKLSGLVLVPVAALSALWVAYRRRDVKGLFILGALMAGIWALGTGWWYLRNLSLYGELFGTHMMVRIVGPRLEPFTVGTLFAEFEGFRIAYWGAFGSVNILTHTAFYTLMDFIVLLAVIGIVRTFYRYRHDGSSPAMLVVLCLVLTIGTASLISWTAQTMASQGRLLFPYMAASSTLIALGLAELIRVRRVLAGLVGAFAIFALITPFVWIAPRYMMPPPLDALPPQALPIYARYGDVALIGYDTQPTRYTTDEAVRLTLYWQPMTASSRDYSLYLHLLDANGEVIGKIDSYPGGGLLRTSAWQPGAIYADTYNVPLEDATGAFDLRLLVGWWDYATGEVFTPQDENDAQIPMAVLSVGGFAADADLEPESQAPALTSFGDAISLLAYEFNADALLLTWRTEGTLDAGYTVFVQLLDSDESIIAQADAPPLLSTQFWRAGETYTTRHALTLDDLPADDDYRLIIGWYRAGDFMRLTTEAPDDAYILRQSE